MLQCVSRYKSSLGVFAPGDVIDDLTLEFALLTDSPLSFQEVVRTDPEVKQAVSDGDKMVRRGKAK